MGLLFAFLIFIACMAAALALDLSLILPLLVGLIPWCIACSVPLSFFGVGIGAIPFACYLYIMPCCYLFTKRRWFNNRAENRSRE